MSNSANLSNVISIGKDDREVIRYPKFLKLIFFVEMWERFSYYGMRALLVLFLISHLHTQNSTITPGLVEIC
jgi:proton-dependent oligopeptide transporter, POT family